jgi:hypothetical protein
LEDEKEKKKRKRTGCSRDGNLMLASKKRKDLLVIEPKAVAYVEFVDE